MGCLGGSSCLGLVGNGLVKRGHLLLGSFGVVQNALQGVGSSLGDLLFFGQDLLCSSILLSHGLWIQRELLDHFAIGGVPDKHIAVPIAANDELGVMAGDGLGRNLPGENEITLLGAIGVPESSTLVLSTGDEHAVQGTCK